MKDMEQKDWTDQRARKRQTLAEIRAEIDRLYAPPVDDEDSAPDESAAPGRWLAVGVVAGVASAVTMAALLMGTPAPRQALQGQERTTVTVAPGSPAVAESQQPATDVGGLPDPGAPPDDESVLRASVDLWLAATNQRDLSGVLAFYPERVPRFYLALDVSRDIVAADKARQFRQATVLDVHRISDVALTIDPGGDAALMRFTKGYVLTGPGLNRQGESLHELRWAKRATGWTIVSERDLRVLR